MAHFCPVCLRAVLDTEEGIGCDGACQRWFHRDCLRMTKAEYQRLCGGSTKWMCTRSDCLDSSNQPNSLLLNQLSLLTDKISDLAIKVDSLTSLPSKVDNLIAELDVINKNISSLENRVQGNETKITILEERVAGIRVTDMPSNPEEILAEMHDRARRSRNVMIFNLMESTATGIDIRKKFDHDIINKLLATFLSDAVPEDIKILRLGKKQKDKPKPMKVIFAHESDVQKFLSSFKPELASQIDQRLSSIRVSRDRTPREISYLNSLRNELNRRTSLGEKDLTIKYMNKVPVIVNNKKNV